MSSKLDGVGTSNQSPKNDLEIRLGVNIYGIFSKKYL